MRDLSGKLKAVAFVAVVIIVIVVIWWVAQVVLGIGDFLFWWTDDLAEFFGQVQEFAVDVFDSAYSITDNAIQAISPDNVVTGLDGRVDGVSLGEGLATGIIYQCGQALQAFLGLFGMFGNALGG